ncbi:MAG: hypothetical protein PVG32_18830 [Anaerolineales bacterium]
MTRTLYQNDPRWKEEKLGLDNKVTIGDWGCLLTDLAMIANGFGCDETPKTLNDKLKAIGGFQGALVIPAMLPSVCPGAQYKGVLFCEKTPTPIAKIDSALAAGMPVIVQVDRSPKANLQSHWVVLYSKKGNDYLMLDPYQYSGDRPDKKLLIGERYFHTSKDPATAITAVLWFEGIPKDKPEAPIEKKPQVPVPKDSVAVYTTGDGLALRDEPSLTGALIKRFPLRTELVSLEKKRPTIAKVGEVNEWLHVQDATNDQGYVAAWYLSTQKEESGEPFPTIGDKEFILQPTVDGLAFRQTPIIAETTLIKRLPLNASLVVMEPIERAKQKLGVVGEWIQVRDIAGLTGYVAAWLVTSSDNPALGVRREHPKFHPDPDQEILVRTTADALALRTDPKIADDTLVKWLPFGSELLVLEEGGEQKIGVLNQWLKVRDIEGDEGYTAAWFVEKRN